LCSSKIFKISNLVSNPVTKENEMTESSPPRLLVQVINLARRPDRLAKISAELNKAGLSFEIQVAVDGENVLSNSNLLSKGEIGCFKSHLKSLRRQAEIGATFSLVFEDDAILSPEVNEALIFELTDLMYRNKLDILQIGFIQHFYKPSLHAGIFEFLIALLKGRGIRDNSGVRFVTGEFRAGAHAYIVNSRLARAISDTLSEPPLIPWDGYLESLARGQVGRGDIRIARLVKPLVYQDSRKSDGDKIDSDISL